MRRTLASMALAAACTVAGTAQAQRAADPPEWNTAREPFRLYGNAYYVGTLGLTSILITSDKGHILIDGTVPEAAPKIAASIRSLGFRVEDVRLILNTHVHWDHAGGLAELQRLSGAKVAASAPAAKALRAGKSGPDDPQFRALQPPIPKVARVQVFKDGEILKVGPLAITAHLTPGHTPGGTSWAWQSCESERCVSMVYADSLSPVAAPGFKFTNAPTNPHVLQSFEQSFAVLSALKCEVLVTPHPEMVDLFGRIEKRERGDANAIFDSQACEKYVAVSREGLRKRIQQERAQ